MKIDIRPILDDRNNDLIKEVIVLLNAIIRVVENKVIPSNEVALAFHYLENAALWVTKACNGPLKEDVKTNAPKVDEPDNDAIQATG